MNNLELQIRNLVFGQVINQTNNLLEKQVTGQILRQIENLKFQVDIQVNYRQIGHIYDLTK